MLTGIAIFAGRHVGRQDPPIHGGFWSLPLNSMECEYGYLLLVYGVGILLIVHSEGSWVAVVFGILWMAGGTVGIVFWIRKKIKKLRSN